MRQPHNYLDFSQPNVVAARLAHVGRYDFEKAIPEEAKRAREQYKLTPWTIEHGLGGAR